MPHDILKQELGKLRFIPWIDHWYHGTINIFLIWMPNGDEVPFILDGMVWASMIHDMGDRIFGDLLFFLPLEGNMFAAQDQYVLYTFHEWRGRQ